MNFDIIEEYKDHIGKIFYALSIIIFFYLLLNPAMGLYIHIDEQFTLGLIQLPFADAWKLIVSDVHPPLYYLILIFFKNLHLPIGTLYLTKLLSMLPLAILLLLSITKIRKDYGWLACGVFTFAISTLGMCAIVFVTSRMYSWSVLFLVMAFICYGEVLKKSNVKSWVLLTLFTVLCMYTHYILFFPLLVMYITYFIYIEYNEKLNKQIELKKVFASAITSFILYVPWLFTLAGQTALVNNNYSHTTKISGESLVNFFMCYVLQDTKHLMDLAFWKFLAVLLAIIILILFITQIKRFKDYEAFHIFSGMTIYAFTIIIATFFVTVMFKGLTVRYFVAIMAVLWLSIAMLLSKVKNNRLLLVALIIILVLGANGFNTNMKDINFHNDMGLKEKNITDSINNPNTVVIYNGTYNTHHHLLNNTKEYSLKKYVEYDYHNYIYEPDLSKIMEDNRDKDIYLISVITNNTENDEQYPDGITGKKLARQGRVWIMKLNQVVPDEEGLETDEESTTESEE